MGFFSLKNLLDIISILGIKSQHMRLYWRDARWKGLSGTQQSTEVNVMIGYIGRQAFPKDKDLDTWLIDRHFIPSEDREVFLYQNPTKPTLAQLVEVYEKIKHLELEDNHLEFNWTRHAPLYIIIDWEADEYDKIVTLAKIKQLNEETHFSLYESALAHDPNGFKWFLKAEF